ncbi:hypothetical protein ASF73_12615 [Xanthomonas sp. Leaf131]|nr:hypothetical protein ASF73_12615 [Xanthomonas sp. Leaf131]
MHVIFTFRRTWLQWERKAVDDALGVVALRFAREPDTMHSLDRRMKKSRLAAARSDYIKV